MAGKPDYKTEIDKYYPADSIVRGILLTHSGQVRDLALRINAERQLEIAPDSIEAAAMLHDIGIIFTDAPALDCHGTEPYMRHGIVGADLLRSDGVDEYLARVAERHTGAGLTADDIIAQQLPLDPTRDYMPQTTLERLISYADCFYSKSGDMQKKSLKRVRASMARLGEAVARRFEALVNEFGEV